MANNNEEYKNIKGWGIDADPENEPTYPMKKWNGADHNRLNWERPPLQEQTVEVLHSNERPNLSAVYGSPLPPTGLSGVIRRMAFKKSESEYGHWLPLLIADRVNVIEGIIDDLLHGHIPNIFAEKGIKADWKHNKKHAVKQLAIATGIVIGIAWILWGKNIKRKIRSNS